MPHTRWSIFTFALYCCASGSLVPSIGTSAPLAQWSRSLSMTYSYPSVVIQPLTDTRLPSKDNGLRDIAHMVVFSMFGALDVAARSHALCVSSKSGRALTSTLRIVVMAHIRRPGHTPVLPT